jgi:parallel beta-helix repeat protein
MTVTMIAQSVLVTLLVFCWIANAQVPLPTPVPFVQTISISQFGAKGDGKTDDTKPILSAIATAANSGARLELENNTYLLTGTLRIPKTTHPISIIGGEKTRLLFAPPNALDTAILISNDSAVELKSFAIQGSNAGLAHGISIDNSTDVRLDHLKLEDIHGTGALETAAIVTSNDDRVWITNSIITGVGVTGKRAFAIWNYYRMHSDHIYIDHNVLVGNTVNIAVGLFDTEHSIVEDNTIDGGNTCVAHCNNNGYGVLFYRANYHGLALNLAPKLLDETVTGNRIRNTAGSGIYLQGVANSKITHNTITNSTQQMDDSSLPAAAIALNYTDNIQILDNTIQHDGKGGVALATTKDVLIEGNKINDSPQWGIHLRVSQVRTTIKNNTIVGAPIGVMVESDAAGTTLDNNVQVRVSQLVKHTPGH